MITSPELSNAREILLPYHSFILEIKRNGYKIDFDCIVPLPTLEYSATKVILELQKIQGGVIQELDRIIKMYDDLLADHEKMKSLLIFIDRNEIHYSSPVVINPEQENSKREKYVGTIKSCLDNICADLKFIKEEHLEFLEKDRKETIKEAPFHDIKKLTILPRIKSTNHISILDRNQVILLFYLLREEGVFNKNITLEQIGAYAKHLTGYSHHKISEKITETYLDKIMSDGNGYVNKAEKLKAPHRLHNLETVKQILVNMVKTIDKQLNK